jgi:hypothetical protein
MNRRLVLGFKALRELGLRQVGLYALYRLGLKSGYFKWRTPAKTYYSLLSEQKKQPESFLTSNFDIHSKLHDLYPLTKAEVEQVRAQAQEIREGQVRLFGGPPVKLGLASPPPLHHWTEYESGHAQIPGVKDIKFLWEPTRFGWAFILGRAYSLDGNEDNAEFFWNSLEKFLRENPPNLGPNWISGQEIGLRVLAFIYAASVFASSPHTTPKRSQVLAEAVAIHTSRLPLTLSYARSQNNNHLLSEAVALYSTGLVMPDHPKASYWRRTGWYWMERGLQTQIASDGTFVQHSTNYHRLMLQLCTWIEALKGLPGAQLYSENCRTQLARATGWLSRLVEPTTGQVPNLGANDGAYILPLSPAPFSDFRPVINAADRSWQTYEKLEDTSSIPQNLKQQPSLYLLNYESKDGKSTVRCFLHTPRFSSRPSHADQLHLDLWWNELNVAMDAGSYRYADDPPWNNPLVSTAVHNTVGVDNQDQMIHAGRFLWLDWAQAEITKIEFGDIKTIKYLEARHDGYRRINIIHQRIVSLCGDSILVVDNLLPYRKSHKVIDHSYQLQWLLPDCPWSLKDNILQLLTSNGVAQLEINGATHLSLARAGEIIAGPGPCLPISGWVSTVYNQKDPALALISTASGPVPKNFTTKWSFNPK